MSNFRLYRSLSIQSQVFFMVYVSKVNKRRVPQSCEKERFVTTYYYENLIKVGSFE